MTLVRCAAFDVGNVRGERVCVYACDCMSSQKNLDKLGTRECRGMSEGDTCILHASNQLSLLKKLLSLTSAVTGKNKQLETCGM